MSLRLLGGAINVREFGAVGDGTADDTTALQNAINAAVAAGQMVFIPAGIYKFSKLTIDGTVSVIGAGVRATVLKTTATNGAAIDIRHDGSDNYSLFWHRLSGFTLTTNGGSEAVEYGIRLVPSGGATYVGMQHWSDIRVTGLQRSGVVGMLVRNLSHGQFDSVIADYLNAGTAFKFGGTVNSGVLVFHNCKFGEGTDQTTFGLVFEASAGLLDSFIFNACYFRGKTYPVAVEAGMTARVCAVQFNACHFENGQATAGNAQVYFGDDTSGWTFTSCLFAAYNASPNVLRFAAATDHKGMVLSGCTFQNVPASGWVFASDATPTFEGCAMFGAFYMTTTPGLFQSTAPRDMWLLLSGGTMHVWNMLRIGARRHAAGTAAPASGTWLRGDICWNQNPSAGGTPGWVCTAGGTPGTWKAMSNLAT
jgi:hypothetical protein